MDYLLFDMLRRIEQRLGDIYTLLQRIVILGGLASSLTILGYHSPEAQELFTKAVRSFILKH